MNSANQIRQILEKEFEENNFNFRFLKEDDVFITLIIEINQEDTMFVSIPKNQNDPPEWDICILALFSENEFVTSKEIKYCEITQSIIKYQNP